MLLIGLWRVRLVCSLSRSQSISLICLQAQIHQARLFVLALVHIVSRVSLWQRTLAKALAEKLPANRGVGPLGLWAGVR